MKKLIICADDFGFSQSVNDTILDIAEWGNVTATSVMVNMPFAEKGCYEAASRCPNLSMGLHFTLTSGTAISDPKIIPLLVDTHGRFRNGFLGLWQLLRSSKLCKDVLAQMRTEFFAQLNAMDRLVQQTRLRFDHLDSHQHIHVLPGLFEILHEEAVKRSLFLRVPREPYGSNSRFVRRFPKWFPLGLVKRILLNGFLRTREQSIGYFGILETGIIDEKALGEIIRSLSRDRSGFEVFELNVHPGCNAYSVPAIKDTDASPADCRFHQSPWRECEFNTLKNSKINELFQQYGICRVNFQYLWTRNKITCSIVHYFYTTEAQRTQR